MMGSGLMIPMQNQRRGGVGGGGITVDFDFANAVYSGETLSNGLAVSRASSGYVQNADGTLTSVGSNLPRIGVGTGLLVEENRENIILQSQTLATTWVPASASIASDAILAPDGTMTGDTLIEAVSAATQHKIDQTVTKAAASLPFSGSGFFHVSSGVRRICLLLGNVAQTAGVFCILYPLNGSMTAPSPFGVGFSGGTMRVVALTNGWYWASLDGVTSDALPAIVMSLRLSTGTSGGLAQSYAGDGTSGVNIWGMQLEQAAFATSYIPTTTASVTRPADIATLTMNAATAALGAKGIYAQSNGVAGGTDPRLLDFNGVQALLYPSTTVARATNGTNNADATVGSGSTATVVKSAYGMDAASITAIANAGSQATTANSWGTPSGAVYLATRAAGDRALNGYMQRIALSPTKGIYDGMTA